MGSALVVPAKQARSRQSHSDRICCQYVNKSKVFAFSNEFSDSQSANLMKIVDGHISTQQQIARASLDRPRRQSSQSPFSSLDLKGSVQSSDFQNPFEGTIQATAQGVQYQNPFDDIKEDPKL